MATKPSCVCLGMELIIVCLCDCIGVFLCYQRKCNKLKNFTPKKYHINHLQQFMHPICCNIGLDKSMYSMQINLISMKANEEINKHLINYGWLSFNSCYFAIWSCICCMLYGAWTICSANIFLVQNISQNNFVNEDQWLTRPHPLPGCDPDSWWS